MKIDILDVDNIVQVNALEPVSSPKIFSQGKNFNPDGIFSNEIFGISKGDRRNQFAYIDLINDNYDEPKKDIEIYKKSFERNKSKDFIVQKYLNVSKKKND